MLTVTYTSGASILAAAFFATEGGSTFIGVCLAFAVGVLLPSLRRGIRRLPSTVLLVLVSSLAVFSIGLVLSEVATGAELARWIAITQCAFALAAVAYRSGRPVQPWKRQLGFAVLYVGAAVWFSLSFYLGLFVSNELYWMGVVGFAYLLVAVLMWRLRPLGLIIAMAGSAAIGWVIPLLFSAAVPVVLSSWLISQGWLADPQAKSWRIRRLLQWAKEAAGSSPKALWGGFLLCASSIALVLMAFPPSRPTWFHADSRVSLECDCEVVPEVTLSMILAAGTSDVDVGISVKNAGDMPSDCTELVVRLPGIVDPFPSDHPRFGGTWGTKRIDVVYSGEYGSIVRIPLDERLRRSPSSWVWLLWQRALARPSLSEFQLNMPIAPISPESALMTGPPVDSETIPFSLWIDMPADYSLLSSSHEPSQYRIVAGRESDTPWYGSRRLVFSLDPKQGDLIVSLRSEKVARVEAIMLSFLPFILGVGLTLLFGGMRDLLIFAGHGRPRRG